MIKLTKEEKNLIRKAFELTYGWPAEKLVNRSDIIKSIFKKCEIPTE